jgi:hypothetical protein
MGPRTHCFEQVICEQKIQHGGFIHNQKVQIERMLFVVLEAVDRGIFQ